MAEVVMEVEYESLKAAVAMVMSNGEKWEAVEEGIRFTIGRTAEGSLSIKRSDIVATFWLPLHGWHRVEEPVLCPVCGKEMVIDHFGESVSLICTQIGHNLRGDWFRTEAEAREAMRKLLERR